MSRTKQALSSLRQECVNELKALEPDIKRAKELLRKAANLQNDIIGFDKAIALLDNEPVSFVACHICTMQNYKTSKTCAYCGAILPDDNPMHKIGYGRGDD